MRAKQRGAKWAPEDICALREAWDNELDLQTICVKMERTANSICSKLTELKLLSFDTLNYTYYVRKPNTSFKRGIGFELAQKYADQYMVKKVDAYMRDVAPDAPWNEFFGVVK